MELLGEVSAYVINIVSVGRYQRISTVRRAKKRTEERTFPGRSFIFQGFRSPQPGFIGRRFG